MLLVEEETHTSMEHNREPRNSPMKICPTDFVIQWSIAFSTNGAGTQSQVLFNLSMTPYMINSKWIGELNVNANLEEIFQKKKKCKRKSSGARANV